MSFADDCADAPFARYLTEQQRQRLERARAAEREARTEPASPESDSERRP